MDQLPASTGRGIVACDFFTVETIWLQTLHVLFFIHLSTRQVMGIGSRPAPTPHGSPSRPGTSRWTWRISSWRSGFCCATTTPSSPAPSTKCSAARRPGSSQPRSRRRGPTPMPSGGCRPYVQSVLTGRWCLAGGICCGCWMPMSVIAIASVRTAAWRWRFPTGETKSRCAPSPTDAAPRCARRSPPRVSRLRSMTNPMHRNFRAPQVPTHHALPRTLPMRLVPPSPPMAWFS